MEKSIAIHSEFINIGLLLMFFFYVQERSLKKKIRRRDEAIFISYTRNVRFQSTLKQIEQKFLKHRESHSNSCTSNVRKHTIIELKRAKRLDLRISNIDFVSDIINREIAPVVTSKNVILEN